ncbi:hypothetical protein [Aeromonas media]|uniref:Uncharacterized protein n=1 Tax=Aeromonas media TaxID=651 RepID=A0AAE6VNE0_AERME|nr:hypothetical protein [Aeromonas media]QHQ51139.1 hypothetical protein GWI30_09750 [Aeromonas media]QQQ15371.1 hypothetical protein JJL53_10075 [Aeromonas media]
MLDFDIDSYKRFKSSNALYAAWILPEHVLIQLSDSEYENMPLRELVKYRYAYIGKAVEFGKYIEAHHGYAEQNMRAVIIDIYETGDGVVELVFDFNPFGERNSQIEDGTFGKPQHGTLGICWRNSRYYRAPETYSYYAEVNHGYVAESFSIITDDERYPISPQLYHNTDCEQHKNENWLRL